MKNKKLIWLGFIGTSLVSIIYLATVTKKPVETQKEIAVEIQKNILQPKKEIIVSNIEIDPTMKWPEVGELATYEANVGSVDIPSFAQKMADVLGITRKSTTPPAWSDEKFTRYMTIDTKNETIKYQVDGNSVPEYYFGANPPTKIGALAAAKKFVANFPIWNNFLVDESSVISTQAETNLLAVSFFPTLNNRFLAYDNQVNAPLTVFVGQKNTVVMVTFIPRQIGTSSVAVPAVAIPIIDIQNNLLSGEVVPIDSQNYLMTSEDSEKINRVVVDSVVLEYRMIKSLSKVIPYYRLTGNPKVYYLVPAVKL